MSSNDYRLEFDFLVSAADQGLDGRTFVDLYHERFGLPSDTLQGVVDGTGLLCLAMESGSDGAISLAGKLTDHYLGIAIARRQTIPTFRPKLTPGPVAFL